MPFSECAIVDNQVEEFLEELDGIETFCLDTDLDVVYDECPNVNGHIYDPLTHKLCTVYCEYLYKFNNLCCNSSEWIFNVIEYVNQLDVYEEDLPILTPLELANCQALLTHKVVTFDYRLLTRNSYVNFTTYLLMIDSAIGLQALHGTKEKRAIEIQNIKKCLKENPYYSYVILPEQQIVANLMAIRCSTQETRSVLRRIISIRQLMDVPTCGEYVSWSSASPVISEGLAISKLYSKTFQELPDIELSDYINEDEEEVKENEKVSEELQQYMEYVQKRRQRNDPKAEFEEISDDLKEYMEKMKQRKAQKRKDVREGQKIFLSIAKQWDDQVEKIFNYFKDLFVFVGDKVNSLIENLRSKVVGMMKKVFEELLGECYEAVKEKLKTIPLKKIFIGTTIFVVIVCLVVGGFMSEIMSRNLMRGIREMTIKVEPIVVSESGSEILGIFSYLFNGLYQMDEKTVSKMEKYIKRGLLLISGGTVLANSYSTVLTILPGVLRKSLILTFGSKEQKMRMRVEDWRLLAQSLCSVSKIQHVVVSDVYETKVRELMQEANILIREIKNECPKLLTTNVMNTYTGLFKVFTNLNMRKYNAGGRPLPFCFHIAGIPGVGKTLCVPSLLRDAFGFMKSDVYEHPVDAEFEAGYLDEPVYYMDEFLVNPDKQVQNMRLARYLTLVSTADYRPNYASVDDPNSGIKGNLCRPKMVVTLNNNAYDNVDHQFRAFYRRRRFVILIKRSDRFIPCPDSPENADLTKYTEEEISNFVWAKFLIMSGTKPKSGNVKVLQELSYAQLVDFLKVQYEQHLDLQEKVSGALGEDLTKHQTPQQIIDEVFKDVFDLPKKNYTLMDCAKEYVFKPLRKKYDNIVVSETESEMVRNQFENAYENQVDDGIMTRIPDYVSDHSTGLIAVSLLAACTLAYKVFQKSEVEMPTFVVTESEKPNKESHPKTQNQRGNLQPYNQVFSESELVPQATLELTSYNNDGTEFTQRNVALLIKGRWILTVAHSLKVVEKHKKWKLYYKDHTFECDFNPNMTFVDMETDICVFYFDCKQLPEFKDKIRCFISDDQMSKFEQSYIQLTKGDCEKTSMARKLKQLLVQTPLANGQVQPMIVPEVVEYHAETSVGWCGSAVRILNGPFVNKILGIHIAGVRDKAASIQSYATFVTQEMLNSIMVTSESNLYREEFIPFNQVVNMPLKTKLTKTILHGELNQNNEKEPAILNKNDPRAKGIDPIDVSLEELDKADGYQINVDNSLMTKIVGEELYNLRKIEWQTGKRFLSFEEAVGGVPGLLSSIKMNSSSGYPLCLTRNKPGKKDHVWFDDEGQLGYTPWFRHLVEERVKQMLSYKKGDKLDHRFVMYLKDELRKKKKINNVSTRAIFCNDLVFLVAARMIFGSLIVALQNNFKITGFAIGLNQYSEDMNSVYQFLQPFKRMIDGDYAGFDMHYVEQVQEKAYWIFGELAKMIPGINQNCLDYLYEHETQAPVQVRNKLIFVRCSNKSGCLLTTLINCICNKLYFRGCFSVLEPTLIFDDHARVAVLGDDNEHSVSDKVKYTPQQLADTMKSVFGQEYTAADKVSSLESWKEDFQETMFLGAIPRLQSNGVYTGALRKETLEETPKWSRDKSVSLELTCQQMVDYASQWDEEYFNDYVGRMRRAFEKKGMHWTINDNYWALRPVVAKRTSTSNLDFMRLVFSESEIVTNPSSSHDQAAFNQDSLTPNQFGLTQIPTSTLTKQFQDEGKADQQKLVNKSLGMKPMDLRFGTNSYVRRSTFAWSSADIVGTNLLQVTAPFGLLALLDDRNVQNMPFNHTVYSAPDIELVFQVNGSPFQQGLLVAYFTPLDQVVGGASYENITTFDHVFITPNQSVTSTLTIPFKHFGSAIRNSQGIGLDLYEEIGKLHVAVYSTLRTNTSPTTVDVTMYTRFKTEFFIPTASAEMEVISEGGVQSTTNYNVNSVAGNMPIQNNSSNSNKTDVGVSIPLDNPPLVGGGIPVLQQYSSMSKIVGLEPTVLLGPHPQMLSRQPDSFRNVNETLISDVLARRSWLHSFEVAVADLTGTTKMYATLTSVFNDPTLNVFQPLPPPICLLNQFYRWKADLVFDIVAIKTKFHSFRMLAVLGYGSTNYIAGTENSYITQVLDFNNETSWASVRIPYNNRYEYQRTFEGTGQVNRDITEYANGFIKLNILNELRHPDNVAASVEVFVFIRLENVQVYGMKPVNHIDWTGDSAQVPQVISESELVSNIIVKTEENEASDTQVTPTQNTDNLPMMVSKQPCVLNVGEKFEYVMKDFIEFGRRHTRIDPWNNVSKLGYSTNSATIMTSNLSWSVYPRHWLNHIYSAWSGTLKYRIFVTYKGSSGSASYTLPTVQHIASPVTTNSAGSTSTTDDRTAVNIEFLNADNVSGSIDSTWNATTRVARQPSSVNCVAEERPYIVTANAYFIDISVPFITQANMLPTRDSYKLKNWTNGRIVLTMPYNATPPERVEVYQAFGDDFRYHCYCPISTMSYAPYRPTSGTAATVGSVIGTHTVSNLG